MSKIIKTVEALVKPVKVDILNGVPESVNQRLVRIYRPAATTTQSGQVQASWKIDWDVLPRWENGLMGWSSSADVVQALNIKFRTKEEAIQFAIKQNYNWSVEEPKETKFNKKVYGDNYSYIAEQLRHVKTK